MIKTVFILACVILTSCADKLAENDPNPCRPLSAYKPPQWLVDRVGVSAAQTMRIERCGRCETAYNGTVAYSSCE